MKKEKKIEYNVNTENQKQLEERIAKLVEKCVIKDEKNKNLFFDTVIDGKKQKQWQDI